MEAAGEQRTSWTGRPAPFKWAHRGGAIEAPPSTLHAMRTALAQPNGADGLELDLHRTCDGFLVVCHDADLKKATSYSGESTIADLPLASVREADAAYWWVPGKIADHNPDTPPEAYVHRGRGPDDRDFRVPTLVEVMAEFDAPLSLELKEDGFEEQLAIELQRAGRGNVIVVSFSERRLRRFRQAAPGVGTGAGGFFLVTFWLLSRIGVARRPPAGVVALAVPDWRIGFWACDRLVLRAAHRRHLAVFAWTVDDERRMRRLIALGVDGIITDRPRLLAGLGADGR